MTDLYKVYKSPVTGQWEYGVMTAEEREMKPDAFKGFGWIDDSMLALKWRNDLRNQEAEQEEEAKSAPPPYNDNDVKLLMGDVADLKRSLREHRDWHTHMAYSMQGYAEAIQALQAQHDRSTAHYHSTDLSGIKEDVFALVDWLFNEATIGSSDPSPASFGKMLTVFRQTHGQPMNAWLSEWEAKHLEELYK